MWGLHVHAVVHHGVMMTVDLQSAKYAFTSHALSPVMSKKQCSKRNPNGNKIWMLVNSALGKEQMSFYLWVETFEKADSLSLTVCRRAFQSLGAERWLGNQTVFSCLSSTHGMYKRDCEQERRGLAGTWQGMSSWRYSRASLRQLYTTDSTLWSIHSFTRSKWNRDIWKPHSYLTTDRRKTAFPPPL